MLSSLQCTFSLNQNNVNDYIKPCMRVFGKSKLHTWDCVVPYHHIWSGYATDQRTYSASQTPVDFVPSIQ